MRVLLVPNGTNQRALSAAAELVTWLSGEGFKPVMTDADARAAGMPSVGMPSSDIGCPVLAVALGGDGTILKAFHVLGEAEVPLLGIKFGRLGFLSGADATNMRASVAAALAGEGRVERRATLRADVMMEGRVAGSYRAMNEVVVSRSTSARVITLGVSIDERRIAQLRADGIVVATATGSTAYALSAGGPIVAPDFGGLVVVPIAPHTLLARALVTNPTDTVSIDLPDPARRDACVVIDGELAPSRRAIDSVIVRRGDHDVSLLKLHGRDFYETVADEFFGGGE